MNIKQLILNDIHIRDPYILTDGGKYYMYGTRGSSTWGIGTGLDVYTSDDLKTWGEATEVFSPPENFWADRDFWAPEVHKYKNNYYMFVSFKSEKTCRGTQILKSSTPMGPFLPHSDGPVTPREWECLDGTLYIDKSGAPYMVFCHEWTQIKDGEICAIKLSDDLKCSIGNPTVLFKASSLESVVSVKDEGNYVTDGPFLYRLKDGQLIMIWSSFSRRGYCEIVSYSDNGEIDGTWHHKKDLLFEKDGGHGMLFKNNEGTLCFLMHKPNKYPQERPVISVVRELDNTLVIEN